MTWEETFKSWGAAPSTTEQQKMENAETAIRKAIIKNTKLAAMDVSIILQGSYQSRTNIRLDSDVDICVCLNSTFFRRYPAGKTNLDFLNIDGTITFQQYKNLIYTALGDYFGYSDITPGNKAFDIHSNTYRIDADVVPAFAYRYYSGNSVDDYIQPVGTAFNTDDDNQIINWPHQTYENGKEKNRCTGMRYKKMVRILKRLRNKMRDEKITTANDIESFLIESSVWNVPDEGFNRDTYEADVRYVLANCFNSTLSNGNHASLKEVNDIKYLHGEHQPWTREQANNFFGSAWDYIGFK